MNTMMNLPGSIAGEKKLLPRILAGPADDADQAGSKELKEDVAFEAALDELAGDEPDLQSQARLTAFSTELNPGRERAEDDRGGETREVDPGVVSRSADEKKKPLDSGLSEPPSAFIATTWSTVVQGNFESLQQPAQGVAVGRLSEVPLQVLAPQRGPVNAMPVNHENSTNPKVDRTLEQDVVVRGNERGPELEGLPDAGDTVRKALKASQRADMRGFDIPPKDLQINALSTQFAATNSVKAFSQRADMRGFDVPPKDLQVNTLSTQFAATNSIKAFSQRAVAAMSELLPLSDVQVTLKSPFSPGAPLATSSPKVASRGLSELVKQVSEANTPTLESIMVSEETVVVDPHDPLASKRNVSAHLATMTEAGSRKGAGDVNLKRESSIEALSSQETSPGQAGTPAGQLASRVVAEVADIHASRGVATVPNQGAPRVLRTLEVTLHPAEFGGVQLRISMNAGSVELHVETENINTARILSDDRGGLDQKLKQAGLELTSLTISLIQASSGIEDLTGSGLRESMRPAFASGSYGTLPDPRGHFAGGSNANHGSESRSAMDGRRKNGPSNAPGGVAITGGEAIVKSRALYV